MASLGYMTAEGESDRKQHPHLMPPLWRPRDDSSENTHQRSTAAPSNVYRATHFPFPTFPFLVLIYISVSCNKSSPRRLYSS